MINITHNVAMIENVPMIDIFIIIENSNDFNKLIIDLSENCALATTDGLIENNKIIIDKKIKNAHIYLKPVSCEDVNLIITAYKNEKSIFNKSFLVPNLIKKENTECQPLVIFTGGGGTSVFEKKIGGKAGNIAAKIENKNGNILIHLVGDSKNFLLCLGLIDKAVAKNDFVFYSTAELRKFEIPKELVIKRFLGKDIALHVLVKPDYQKKIRNVFYKSRISNILAIKDSLAIRNISEFKDALNNYFNPLEWIIEERSQLPEKI